MKKTLIAALVGAFAFSANAGDPPAEEIVVDDDIGATLSAGYMTDYIFYGVNLADHAIWTGLDYSLEDTLSVPLSVGVWYLNATDDPSDYDELDVYASYGLPSFAGLDASLNFIAYFFPETSADATYELNLGISRSLGFVDWDALVAYDFEIEGWYFSTGVSKEFGLTDNISLVLSASIGGQNDYWNPSNFWNDVQVKAALPIALNSRATLEPYVGGLFALESTEDFQDDIVHGGVSISVNF